ncbi:TPA: DUF357 domain-containing protein [Candidatus Bathyarchaeota archaeon]|nr:DUF357 domain-containing protein [Candidatus Bathyarchaeota archaeon]
MKAKNLALKYIRKTERALNKVVRTGRIEVDNSLVTGVIEEAKRYLEDAKFYLRKGMATTSLASIAYSEGLLDALRMLGLAEFSW